MSNSGSFAPKDSVLSSGHHGKPRKKRHRKKFRNSSLRKKKTQKSSPVRKTHFFKSNAPRINSNSDNIMSNWYWSNYKKAVEWQERHKVAHWKACALALMEENRYLLQIINDMRPGMVPKVSVMQSSLGEHSNCSRNTVNSSGGFLKFNFSEDYVNKSNDDDDDEEDEEDVKGSDDINNDYEDDNKGIVDDDDDDDDDDDGDFEFEMSEEMMQFFEQSYRHKMDLKKLKEKELLKRAEEEVKQMQMSKFKRSTEMNLLYGDGASMIIGMETAIQLSFDKYCDTKSPKYWPNIPFRL